MPINLEVNGTEYTNFTEVGVNIALDTLANDFSFEAALPDGESLSIKGGDQCTVVVDGQRVLTGYVENITGRHTATQHTIIITGRDRTADLIDSSINVLDDIRDTVTLKELIEKVIAHIGADIRVIDNVVVDPFNKAEDIIAPLPGDNAFFFVEQYAQKRQVLLTSNADGNLVLTQSDATPTHAALQNALQSDTNNITEASWSYMTGNLYNKYIHKGQLDPVALDFGGSKSDSGVVAQQGEAIDANIRAGRQFVSVSAKGYSSDQLKTRAAWSKKVRQARSVAYSCLTPGFTNSAGDLWAVNTLVSVLDEFADINRPLLLNSIQFTYGRDGSRSLLGFVEANAYKLQVSEPKPVGENQNDFIL